MRALLVLISILLPAASPGLAADPARLMIVFDGSGSMWAKLRGERQAKVTVARDALIKALPRLASNTEVGLVSFGHRRQGSCSDAEVVRALQPLDVERMKEALEALNPRGRGPLTLALRETLEVLPKGGAAHTIVLVHDDLDNCQQNPCALVEEIRRDHPGLRLHVISIDLKPQENTQMLCLPRATGGRHFPVQSEAELVAAIDAVITAPATGDDQARATSRGLSQGAAPGRPAAAPQRLPVQPTAPGVHLRAELPGADWRDGPTVRWRIRRLTGDGPPITVAEGVDAHVKLPTGRYGVSLSLGMAQVSREVDVVAEQATVVALKPDIGVVELMLPAGRAATSLADAVVTVAPANTAPRTAASYHARGTERLIPVPLGKWNVDLSRGSYRERHVVDVTAGERSRVDVRAGWGEIELIGVASDGGRGLGDMLYVVSEDDPEAEQGRREILRSAAARPVIALPAGTYHVAARHGEAEARDRIAVRPGETLRRVIVLGAGRLKLAGEGLPQAGPDRTVRWTVTPVGGDTSSGRTGSVQSVATTAELTLTAGRYRVVGSFGRQNAQAVREVTVRAGGEETVSLAPSAARVQMIARDARPVPGRDPRVAAGEVQWTVRDSTGALVWSTAEAEPLVWLQEGTYLVRAELRGGTGQSRVAVKPGGDGRLEVEVR